ncbi:BACK [Seminavis robusta]|uniref:BACK n=1 Tax=Seminavis robusta TaxID=568900 RepID=A0A9N8E1A1_9STRA|nr:BACK [Seminavis robusta]|eukprot:Sro550_g164720.1 BACK (425) ;mRNA; f:37286-38652
MSESMEIDRDTAVTKMLEDATFHDVTLVGNDGVKVGANRTFLGARNPVFRRMLFGGFTEATSREVNLGHPGAVVKAIVEYVHTDTAGVLTVPRDNGDDSMEAKVPGLATPSLSLATLEASSKEGPSVQEETTELAMSHLRLVTNGGLDNSVVVQLTPSVLECILKCDKNGMEELALFNILRTWAESDCTIGGDLDRRTIASQLAEHIRLECIDPRKLSTDVAACGLVSKDRLAEAYKLQAISACEKHNCSYEQRRASSICGLPVWERSSSFISSSDKQQHETELLKTPPISCGIHRWTVQVEKICDYTWVGIALTGKEINRNHFLGFQDGGWVYSHSGTCYHGGQNQDLSLPKFDAGSEVTLTLNLATGDVKNGSLLASVNGGAESVLFKGLRSHLNGNNGFVPATSLNQGGQIRLTDYRILPA